MNNESETYRDALAFARSIGRGDAMGASSILEGISLEDLLDIPVALSWLLIAAVNRIADLEKTDVDAVWLALIEVIDQTEEQG